ncbi:hypothetical protein L579_2634 [Pantoea sp. AS-PWVM4]|uniref:hypothetical protein n=1 Tax=Pantoea sp. AS-PWVM4 TaxID=1332069 RepID=UPI0003AC8616|nr:hypothetical protein [Pantoea sp. AS-PWVM4]ERK06174.1 hypothetical protein L579_2634 [Pantoea sp. AS-PWVM4]
MNPKNAYHGAPPDDEIFDISEWPIVFIRFPQLDMPDRTNRLLNGLSGLLAQQQRLVFVWIPALHGHEREPHEDEKQSSRWMKQYKNEIANYCAGYIYLTDNPAVRASLSEMFPKLRKMMPFPKTLADDRADAIAKAHEYLALPPGNTL